MGYIMGVDPGTLSLGYGIIEGEPLKAVAYGVISPPKSWPLERRLYQLFCQLEEILAGYSLEAVAIEEPFVFKNPRSALSIGRAQGVVLLLSARYNVPIFRYPPTLVKQQVTGYGVGDKYQVQEMVRRQLGLSCSVPEDAADALAIALCHVSVQRSTISLGLGELSAWRQKETLKS